MTPVLVAPEEATGGRGTAGHKSWSPVGDTLSRGVFGPCGEVSRRKRTISA